MIGLLIVLAVSFMFTYVSVPWFIPRLQKANICGKDMNKPDKKVVAEMGGLPIVGGFLLGVLVFIALTTFNLVDTQMNLTLVLACLSTILAMALIGVIDDLLLIGQKVKALLPVFAAFPLIAVNAGVTSMDLPLLGTVDFGLIYPLLLIPLAITGASNATNMLAGFNGVEAGLGVIMCSAVGVVAYSLGKIEAAVIVFAMLGALLAFLRYNWYPAKILIGDVGTLTIGAVIASSVIVGNIEKVGVILIAPFFAELILKARSRFMAQSWCEIKDGKLTCTQKGEIYGLGRFFMHMYGGVSETRLVVTILAVEVVAAAVAIYSYLGHTLF